MVPSFCRLELPKPSYRPIKTLQVLWNTFFALSLLCIENFIMRDYAGFSQIGSHITIKAFYCMNDK